MAETKFLGNDAENKYLNGSGGALQPGAVVQLPDGRAGILQGARALADGEVGKVSTRGRFQVNKLSTAVFAAGDVVDWDNGNDEAVVDAGTGEFMTGIAEAPALNGETTVDIVLNGRVITT